MKRLDLNGDLGESFGVYSIGNDEEVSSFVTSANLACGFHAGDPSVMRKAVKLCLGKGVAIGAHPGFFDRMGFGRRAMDVTPEEAHDLVVYQVGALLGFVTAEGGRLQHVKPHGALYNMASRSLPLAEAIAEAVHRLVPDAILFGLSGSELLHAGQRVGLRVASEVFADRSYQPDGSLTPRQQAGAVIEDAAQAASQLIRMVKEGKVRASGGGDVEVRADTACIHGDGANAAAIAREIRARSQAAGIVLKAIGAP
jgi:UPF0271 protein